jgi:citrate lyase synthetase
MSQFKVIAGGGAKSFVPGCTVTMDNSIDRFTDFVTVGWDNNKGVATLLQNADTITLGYAYLLISQAFMSSYNQLGEEERNLVDATLSIPN